MKTFILSLSLLLGVGCTCAAEKNAVIEIEATYALVELEYLQYIDADPKLNAASRDDRRKLIADYHKLVDLLKKSLK